LFSRTQVSPRAASHSGVISSSQFTAAWTAFSLDLADGTLQTGNAAAEVIDRAVDCLQACYVTPIEKSSAFLEDGNLKFTVGYTNRDYMVPWVLRFGDKARVVEPADLADEVKKGKKHVMNVLTGNHVNVVDA
jgi:hypothetical protein